MYSVETEFAALDEVAVLPPEALPAYAELMTLLEVAPWSGDPYNLQRPDANMTLPGCTRHRRWPSSFSWSRPH